jgi:hypothetical protein
MNGQCIDNFDGNGWCYNLYTRNFPPANYEDTDAAGNSRGILSKSMQRRLLGKAYEDCRRECVFDFDKNVTSKNSSANAKKCKRCHPLVLEVEEAVECMGL